MYLAEPGQGIARECERVIARNNVYNNIFTGSFAFSLDWKFDDTTQCKCSSAVDYVLAHYRITYIYVSGWSSLTPKGVIGREQKVSTLYHLTVMSVSQL